LSPFFVVLARTTKKETARRAFGAQGLQVLQGLAAKKQQKKDIKKKEKGHPFGAEGLEMLESC